MELKIRTASAKGSSRKGTGVEIGNEEFTGNRTHHESNREQKELAHD